MANIYQIGGSNIYWEFPSSVERLQTDALLAEKGKFGWQKDTNTLWMVIGISPTVWKEITGGVGSAPPSYTATFSSSSLWIVNHNLGYEPFIQVLTSGGLELIAEVLHISSNQANVYFSQAQSGRVRAL